MIVQATRRLESWRDADTGQTLWFDWRLGGLLEATREQARAMEEQGVALSLTAERIALRGPLLVLRAKAAGDILMLTPTFRALKAADSSIEIDLACRDEYLPLLEGNPELRRAYGLRQGFPDRNRYGLVADLNVWPEVHPDGATMNRARLFASWFGLELDATLPTLLPDAAAVEEAERGLKPRGRRLVTVFLDAGWPSRRWARMREAADLFSRAGYWVLALGDGASHANGWRELLAVIAISDLVVTADSGPMHAAAALRRPTVAVFLSTDPAVLAGEDYDVEALRGEADCAPCWEARCGRPGGQACSASLTPEMVFERGRALLEKPADEPGGAETTNGDEPR